ETGAGPALCAALAERLNRGPAPAIPREGLGSAGEIIPLAPAFQTLLGIGLVLDGGGAEAPAAEATARAGPPPGPLRPKEGGAVLRGAEARSAVRQQLHAAACTIEALAAPRGGYDPRLAAGADPVLAGVLGELRRLTGGGPVRDSSEVLQAPVSVRVVPQALA